MPKYKTFRKACLLAYKTLKSTWHLFTNCFIFIIYIKDIGILQLRKINVFWQIISNAWLFKRYYWYLPTILHINVIELCALSVIPYSSPPDFFRSKGQCVRCRASITGTMHDFFSSKIVTLRNSINILKSLSKRIFQKCVCRKMCIL